MAWGRRCDLGCESWPDDKRYDKCPSCGRETTRYSNLRPLDKLEALFAEFEAFYEDWDNEHDADRLTRLDDIDPGPPTDPHTGLLLPNVSLVTSRSG